MRFGIITPCISVNDGQGRVNLEIAAEMIRQGHELVFFSEHVDLTPSVAKARHVLAKPPRWVPSRLLRDQIFAWRSRSQLYDRRNRCDAILANGFVSWAKSDVNAVHFVHRSWIGSPFHPWQLKRSPRSLYARTYSLANAILEKVALRRSGRVVAVSEKVRQELLVIGVSEDRIEVITNGVDNSEFYPGPPERSRFGLPQDVTIALFAGDLKTPRKNLDTVLRSLIQIPTLHLAVAGQTGGSVYPALARSMGLADRVYFLGFQTNMPALMRSVDLFVFPSRYEPCGLVLLEAMASGLPVVTARSAGGADLITPEIGVVIEESNDFAALAEALRPLVEEPTRRRTMGEAARLQSSQHSWTAMAQRYILLLTEAATARQNSVG